jgi:spore coat protein A, manganese oxidase
MPILSRRTFITAGAVAAAGWTMLRGKAYAFLQSPRGLRKFIQPLPGLGPTGIPVAVPNTSLVPGADSYRVRVGQYTQQLHPDLPGPSHFWGFADITDGKAPNHRYLGGAIVAQKDRPVRLTVVNDLVDSAGQPLKHPLPVDTSLMGAEPDQAENRICTHLHGGFVPWTSDGGPFAWFGTDGSHGQCFLNPGAAANEAEYYYPNQQSARLMWYHDHAMGITRLNAYVGIATAYVLTDDYEQELIRTGVLPDIGIPLVIQDKSFIPATGNPEPGGRGGPGDLWYPSRYEKAGDDGRWDYGPGVEPPAVITNPTLPLPSCVPEFFSDTLLVNGAVYPYLELEPKVYRFRILNGSQARFYNLQLYYAVANSPTEADTSRVGPAFLQIGTEGGFLPVPAVLNDRPRPFAADPETGNPVGYNLLLAPAERADIVVDFSAVPAGSRLILYNDAPAPFPMGDPLNDYATVGASPDTRSLMQIRIVTPRASAAPRPADPRAALAGHVETLTRALAAARPIHGRRLHRATRDLTLNEDFDDSGRLIQRIGTTTRSGSNNQNLPTWARDYVAEPTERIAAGTREIWRIFNLTGDTHPIHFHLFNALLIGRARFDTAEPVFEPVEALRPPDANELGYKETIRMNPGEVTVVAVDLTLPTVPFAVPPSPRTGGHEYVWHCHILEHEEHDMMRPLVVMP